MAPRNRNIVVGVVVILAGVALGWMVLRFSSMPMNALFAKGTAFTVTANRADGLSDGSSVTYLGVTVGRVLSVKRVPNQSQVEISAVLNKGETLPSNVVGIIRPQGPLSPAAAVQFDTAGPPSPQPLADGAVVKAAFGGGGVIPPEFTDLARSIQEQKLVAHLDETILEMRTQLLKAGAAMDSLNAVVGDPRLREDLAAAMASIKSTSQNLDKFAIKLDGVAEETTDTLKQVRTTLAGADTKLESLTKQVGDRLTQTGDLLDKLNAVATRVDKGEGTLGKLANDPRLYESIIDASAELNLTIKDLRRLVAQWEQEGFSLKLK